MTVAAPRHFLQVSNLAKQFGDVSVLKQVSFDLAKGECIALVGPSGCGKTTTLRCIGGLEHANSGEIRLEDRILSDGNNAVPPQEREMGMVFQSYSVWPHLTVFENVAFGLRLRKVAKSEVRTRVVRTLELMNIGHLAERKSYQLSGGQLQRVALARTLVVEPKLVLFDEPLSNLDAQLRAHMRTEIRSLLKRLNMSAVYVTHDQSEASVVADRTAVMHEGQIQQIGAWSDLYFRPANRFVAEFMGAGNLLAGVVKSIDASGICVGLSAGDVVIDPGRCVSGLKVGDGLTVYAPRESISISSGRAGAFSGRIDLILPGPAVFEVAIRSDIGLLSTVKLATDDIPSVGEACTFSFSASHLSGFAPDAALAPAINGAPETLQ